MKIEIIKDDATDALVVWQGLTNSNVLTTGEMIEQVLGLLKIQNRPPYPMKTPDEWNKRYPVLSQKQNEEPTP